MQTYEINIQLSRGVQADPIELSLDQLKANNWKLEFTVASSEIVEAISDTSAAQPAEDAQPATEIPMTPTAIAEQQSVTPRGQTLTANGWEITVQDAIALPDPPETSVAYNVVVTLNVRNTLPTPRTFGKPDMDFSIKSEQGWAGRYDIFKSSSASVAVDEWTGLYSQGFDYQHTIVFSVRKWDPNLYQSGLSGWILTITDGDSQYMLELGDVEAP